MNFHKILLALLIVINTGFLFAQETVIIRTDRDTYISGESVWIQANCLKSGSSIPSEISNVIYVEVLNNENAPVYQLKLNAKKGASSTQFVLPDNLATGNYCIRAYTKWMRNYNADLFSVKNIAVINPFSNNSFPKSDKFFNSDTLIFYTEGGRIIQNQNNKIIAQSFDEFGNSKSLTGEIISPSNKSILKAETSDKGYFVFNLNPEEQGVYKFRFSKNDKEITFPLGEVSDIGINLQLVQANSASVKFKLATNNRNENNFDSAFLHIVTSNGDFVNSHPVLLKNQEEITIDTESLPSGFLCALLVEQSGNVISSRYFTTTKSISDKSICIEPDQKNYTNRSLVNLKISNLLDVNDVSVSVVKKCLLNSKSQIGKIIRPDNIPLQTLLQITNSEIAINDILLCFNPFEQVKTNTTGFSSFPEMKGEIISGTILNMESQQPIINKVFMLSFVGKFPTINFAKTDSLGRFSFITNRFGEQEIVIQPFGGDTLDFNYKVNLDLAFCPEYSTAHFHPLFINAENVLEINKAIINMQVNALYKSYGAFPIEMKKESDPVCFYGNPEISIVTNDFIELPNMEEIIREIVPNTHLIKKNGKFEIRISEGETLNSMDSETFCMVDGVPVKDQNNILKMAPEDVEKIDVINLDYFIRNYRLGNVLNITTSSGDMSAYEFDPRLFRQVHNSYSPNYSFSSPDYSLESLQNSKIPDFRNLLYWNPGIDINADNEANVSFFTSDETAEYVIVVEGINNDGIVERQIISLEVREE